MRGARWLSRLWIKILLEHKRCQARLYTYAPWHRGCFRTYDTNLRYVRTYLPLDSDPWQYQFLRRIQNDPLQQGGHRWRGHDRRGQHVQTANERRRPRLAFGRCSPRQSNRTRIQHERAAKVARVHPVPPLGGQEPQQPPERPEPCQDELFEPDAAIHLSSLGRLVSQSRHGPGAASPPVTSCVPWRLAGLRQSRQRLRRVPWPRDLPAGVAVCGNAGHCSKEHDFAQSRVESREDQFAPSGEGSHSVLLEGSVWSDSRE